MLLVKRDVFCLVLGNGCETEFFHQFFKLGNVLACKFNELKTVGFQRVFEKISHCSLPCFSFKFLSRRVGN